MTYDSSSKGRTVTGGDIGEGYFGLRHWTWENGICSENDEYTVMEGM